VTPKKLTSQKIS